MSAEDKEMLVAILSGIQSIDLAFFREHGVRIGAVKISAMGTLAL